MKKKILFKKKKKIGIRTSAYFNEGLNVKTLNRSTTPASIVLAISQRYQIRIARRSFIDRIFKPGLLFSLSTWTRPTYNHSEVKIGPYQLTFIAVFFYKWPIHVPVVYFILPRRF